MIEMTVQEGNFYLMELDRQLRNKYVTWCGLSDIVPKPHGDTVVCTTLEDIAKAMVSRKVAIEALVSNIAAIRLLQVKDAKVAVGLIRESMGLPEYANPSYSLG